ncbi:MAG: bifunctional (p)ppGpp synthetase/guanosine-3',5'-bis(diphosphate) 3'-pyrophosphohydrolase [Steroidobacteraceae bacterium]
MERTLSTTADPATLGDAARLLETAAVAASSIERASEAARLAFELSDDGELASAVAVDVARQLGTSVSHEAIEKALGTHTARLSTELAKLGEFTLAGDWSASQGLNEAQAETLRKMLLAVASDPRLIIARLAGQLVMLRHARELEEGARRRLALVTREIYAPLANRLGIWNLKWELEDLAFRFLEPGEYKRIAAALAERRVDRERYIEEVCALLKRDIAAAGVEAEVYGRPKHIYSIWRKMQRKHLAFEQLFDVRAVRIVVASIADCYAALGVVHGLWRYIPGEFDDYIATPKDNNYRSIHTAVIGPEGKSLEIQIRTRDMHESAELGVAAHWRYKEGGARNAQYERKIEWVRRLLDPAQHASGEGDFIENVRAELFSDRIYTLTPRGEVVDLPRDATPLDFAYHVHTQLGHNCRGAKVNGRIVPLNHPLQNGAIVEIITGRSGGPSRDWLLPEEGFLVSPRSRAKVRARFRAQEEAEKRASPASETPAPVAPTPPPEPTLEQLVARKPARSSGRSPIDIEGVGDLPTTMGRCCAPVPPEPISGYLTLGRGVTIHRASCPNLARMRAVKPERVLRVEWNLNPETLLPVKIRVEALDRRGLLRDVSDVLAVEKLSINGVNSDTDPTDRIATIEMRTAVHDTEELQRVMKRLRSVPNVLKVERAG